LKDKFASWAREANVPIEDDWTVEQISDAIIAAKVPWPPELTNEQGWQLWTAVTRREYSVQSIQWDEVSGEDREPELEVTFRLQDKREFQARITKKELQERDFGGVCKMLEERLRDWKVANDAEREEEMRKQDAQWEGRAPDLMDYVIGFRAWAVNGPRLRPIGMGGDVWEGGAEVRAQCSAGNLHRAPDPNCECGLYAWNDLASMLQEARAGSGGRVWGAVRAHGRLEVHSTGFRAEYMQPMLLGYDDSEDEIVTNDDGIPVDVKRGSDYDRVKKIADLLGGIEVVPFDVLPEAATEFGRLIKDVPELLPDDAG
jgi:hypothetical protein